MQGSGQEMRISRGAKGSTSKQAQWQEEKTLKQLEAYCKRGGEGRIRVSARLDAGRKNPAAEQGKGTTK